MHFRLAIRALHFSMGLAFFLAVFPAGAQQKTPQPLKSAEAWANEPMVDLAMACPTIRIELRYATRRNITGKPIYPANARCFVRQSMVQRLQRAQDDLNEKGYGLKIWD